MKYENDVFFNPRLTVVMNHLDFEDEFYLDFNINFITSAAKRRKFLDSLKEFPDLLYYHIELSNIPRETPYRSILRSDREFSIFCDLPACPRTRIILPESMINDDFLSLFFKYLHSVPCLSDVSVECRGYDIDLTIVR